MSAYLRVEALDGTGVTLIDETQPRTPLDPVVQTGTDWGNPQWDTAFSGPRGTLGRTGLQTQVSDRDVVLAVRLYGSSIDDLAARVAAYVRVVEEIRRQGGGRIIRRAHTSTVKASLQITATKGAATSAWTARSETVPRRDVTVAFTTAPYWEGDPMDCDLALATGADTSLWSYSPASPPGTITLMADGLRRTGSNQDLVILPATYRTADHQVTATFVAGGNASQVYGLVGRWVDANNHVRCRLVGTSLTVSAVIGGNVSLTGTATVTAPTAGQVFTLRLTVMGDTAAADYWAPGTPVVDTAPTAIASTATTGSVGNYGVLGRPGAVLNSNNQTDQARVQQIGVRPYTLHYGGSLPTVIPMHGVPGDAPARADLELTVAGNQSFEYGLVGWQEMPAAGTVNMLDDGEVFGAYPVSKWTVVGGATLSKQTTGGVSGTDVIRVAGTTSNPSGMTRTQVLDNGTVYPYRQRTVECWVRSTSGTVPVQLSAGGQTASGSATATTWTKLSVTFIPTVAGNVTIQIAKTGASAGTFDVDDVQMYAGPATSLQRPNAAPAPFGVLMAVNAPNAVVSSHTAGCYVDPSFLLDGGAGGDLVEVWGRVALHSSTTAAQGVLRVRHESGTGDPQYTLESGAVGRSLRPTGQTVTKLIRYGTIRLPEGRCYLEPRHTYTTSATATATGTSAAVAAVGSYTQWTNPGNATIFDGSMVTAAPAPIVADEWSFNITIPAGSVIQAVDVLINAASCDNPGSQYFDIVLTTDNWVTSTGTLSLAPGGSPTNLTTAVQPDRLWRRTWVPGDFTTLKAWVFGRADYSGYTMRFDQLQVAVTYATNAPAVESLILVPADARCVTPTGVASTRWAVSPGSVYRKTVTADLSAQSGLVSAEASGHQVTPGMGGALIELPPGDCNALVKLSTTVPDGANILNAADPGLVTNVQTHLAVTPRWTILREPVS